MIVGAGVAGCYLGSLVGDAEILEKRKEIAEKPCSGLVSKSGLDSLKLDYRDCVLNRLRGAKFFAGRESFEVGRPKPVAVVLDRLAFQKSLAEQACDEGCTIKFGKAWRGESDGWVAGADGAVSAVAKACGVGRRKYFFTYQQVVELSKRPEDDFVELHFGDFAPGFFAWMIPQGGRTVEIGVGCDRGNARKNCDAFSKKFEIKRVVKEQAALIPVFDPDAKTVFGEKALVGDAAGQNKASTGGGIVFGLKCAEVLAEAIRRNDLTYYERQWRKQYEGELKNHLRLRRFLNSVDCEELFRRVRRAGLDEAFSDKGDMDLTSSLMFGVLKKPAFWLRYLPKFLFV